MLEDYLDRAALPGWRWNAMDCCVFAGDWVRERTGRDPFEPYRGAYKTARAAQRLIEDGGGLLNLVDAEMKRCGFAETDTPEDGDIAVIAIGSAHPTAVANASVVIRCGTWWVGRTLEGIGGFDAPVLKAWRVA
jgi:hypothetical protein